MINKEITIKVIEYKNIKINQATELSEFINPR